jgi:hypothetical protein
LMECLRRGRVEMKDDRCHRDDAGNESETDGARLGKGRRSPLLARKPNSTPYIVHNLTARNIAHFSRSPSIALWCLIRPPSSGRHRSNAQCRRLELRKNFSGQMRDRLINLSASSFVRNIRTSSLFQARPKYIDPIVDVV